MSSPIIFELYRYQILPIDRFQEDMWDGIANIDELISQKNSLFFDVLLGTERFFDAHHTTTVKKLFSDEDFVLYQLGVHRKISRETKDFRDEKIDSWPSILLAVWNAPDKQLIAVQKRTTAFQSTNTAVKLIIETIKPNLAHRNLRVIQERLFETKVFWELLEKYRKRVQYLEFEMITPNMANISGSLSEDLKNFNKHSNATRSKLKLEADPESALHLEESDETLQGLVEYASNGGGNINIKINNIKKIQKTNKSVRSVEINGVMIQGNAEMIVEALKRLINDKTKY